MQLLLLGYLWELHSKASGFHAIQLQKRSLCSEWILCSKYDFELVQFENEFSFDDSNTRVQILRTFIVLVGQVIFNPFPHTTILQQTTLNIFRQKIENLNNWVDNLWLKEENIVAKGEIARFDKFLLFSLCFQNNVCFRGVRKLLYEGMGLICV